MATTSFTAPRRFASVAIALLLFTLCFLGRAPGQGTVPPVTATSAVGLSHPTGWGAIQQSAINSEGDWVVDDYANGAVYEFPAGGQAAVTLVAAAGLGGGYENPAVVIDPNNDLYLGANWNNGVVMFPWDASTRTWTGLSAVVPLTYPTTAICTNSGKGNGTNCWAQYGIGGYSQGYFQPWGMAIGANNTMLIGNQNSGNFIMSLGVNGAWTNPVSTGNVVVEQLSTMTKRPISVAQDPEGNVYFVEDSGGLPGLYRVPAGSNELAADTDPSITRVDPNLPSVSGVIIDTAGNLYISDSTEGVFLVPNPSGTPQTSAAVWLTSVPAEGEAAIDWTRNILYVPTTQKQSNNLADAAEVGFGYAEYGSSPIGKAASSGANVDFGFNVSETPSRFAIVEDGAATPDFAITGGTCTTGTAYAVSSSCVENITFTPTTVGSISAKLLMQTAQAESKGSPDASDSITAYSASGNVLTLTAANSLAAGELIQVSASAKTDALNALDGQQFNVLSAGLSPTQFEIQTSAVSGSGGASSTSATVTGYSYTTVSSIVLHGTGVGANIQTAPALESEIGGGLMTPSQVAVDGEENVYVADAGLGKVLRFAAGSGTTGTPSSVGTGLTAPSGVAVDHTGDIFIADYTNNVGTVYEIPYAASGLNTGGGQITLASGFGNNLSLAVDGLGNVYIADPSNKQVVKLSVGVTGQAETMLTAGFTAPTAVATDASNNLYVVDGSNLFELAAQGGIALGAPTAVLNNLSGATGVAADPSGAVYITEAGGTVRIPSINGALAPASETAIATGVTNPDGVTLDQMGNVYLADGTALQVHVVTTNGTLELPTPASLTSSTSVPATVTNIGNSALSVTGYTSTNAVDFTAADGSCIGDSPLAAGGTCVVDVTFDPGAGQQGTLTGQIGVTSNALNSPIMVDTTGVGLTLGNSATSLTVGGAAQVISTPVSVAVVEQGGTGPTPTGQVTVSYTSWTVKTVTCTSPCPQEIVPVTNTVTANLDNNGNAQFTLAPVMAGADTFSVSYSGDRVYGTSTKTITAAVAKSQVASLTVPIFPDPSDVNLPFVVPGNGTGSVPYDSSETPWQYNFNMKVNTAFGIPTGTITMMDNSSTCPPGTSATGVGAATCALANYSGVACPQNSAQGNLIIENSSVPNSSGTSFATSCLYQVPSGTTYTPVIYTHYVTPVYSGDANFQTFTGASTLLQATRGPLVQITTPAASSATTPPTVSVSAGSTASVNLTLTSILGYGIAGKNGLLNNSTFPVTLSCDGLPPHATCSFYYPTPDPNISTAVDIPWPANCSTQEVAEGLTDSSGDVCAPSAVPVTTSSGVMTTGTGQAVMTINTDVTVGTTTSRNVTATSVTLAAIFGFGMIGLFVRRRAFEKGRLLLMVALMVIAPALAVSITACSTTNLLPEAELKSPSGTYAVTVTAQQVGDQCEPSGPLGSNCTTTSGGSGQLAHGSNNPVSLPFTVNVTVQ